VVKPSAKIGRRERDVIEERRGQATGALVAFDGDLERTLRTLVDRLLPGVPTSIDVAAFVDAHLGEPLGRGDQRAGLPPVGVLLVRGVHSLAENGFLDMTEEEQRDVITRMRSGGLGAETQQFIDRLLDKALMGYLSHPDAWTRIGFNGPAYPNGYAWIDVDEVAARHDRKRGWDQL
jgi:hypothetical protein